MEPVYYANEEFETLLLQLEKKMREAEQSPYPQAADMVHGVLQTFDRVHREPLARLARLLAERYPAARAELEADYTVRTLLSLYDLSDAAIEKSPLSSRAAVGFVPEDAVTLLSPDNKPE